MLDHLFPQHAMNYFIDEVPLKKYFAKGIKFKFNVKSPFIVSVATSMIAQSNPVVILDLSLNGKISPIIRLLCCATTFCNP